jgi:hypothetical protein
MLSASPGIWNWRVFACVCVYSFTYYGQSLEILFLGQAMRSDGAEPGSCTDGHGYLF